jgi:hypothetical protein
VRDSLILAGARRQQQVAPPPRCASRSRERRTHGTTERRTCSEMSAAQDRHGVRQGAAAVQGEGSGSARTHMVYLCTGSLPKSREALSGSDAVERGLSSALGRALHQPPSQLPDILRDLLVHQQACQTCPLVVGEQVNGYRLREADGATASNGSPGGSNASPSLRQLLKWSTIAQRIAESACGSKYLPGSLRTEDTHYPQG